MISFAFSMLCLFGTFGCPGGLLIWALLAILSTPSFFSRGRFPRRRFRRH